MSEKEYRRPSQQRIDAVSVRFGPSVRALAYINVDQTNLNENSYASGPLKLL